MTQTLDYTIYDRTNTIIKHPVTNRYSSLRIEHSVCLEKHGLDPIIKWPGGKEKELKYILPNLPKQIHRYFEPFVGGGAVFMAINNAKEYFINDKSNELISLYSCISEQNHKFFHYAKCISQSWSNAECFFTNHKELLNFYLEYRNNEITDNQLCSLIKTFCIKNIDSLNNIISPEFTVYRDILFSELEKNIKRKMLRMKVLEIQKHLLADKDLENNVQTAIKSAIYMYYRYLYNNLSMETGMKTAIFLFIRNFAYSAMFRYNDKGEFNVPYGGIAYNSKSLTRKLNYYQSDRLLRHFSNSHFYDLDFEDFLNSTKPQADDFIFLDPPYDTDFSTYAQNVFSRNDQQRLASWLLSCEANWMLIIKNTDFIYNLYSGHKHVYIKTFDKKYAVSFMNRNDRNAEHLLITNY